MNKMGISIFLCCILLLTGCAETGTMTKSEKGGLRGSGRRSRRRCNTGTGHRP